MVHFDPFLDGPTAFLIEGNELYFSHKNEALGPASSPAVNLIQGLFQKYPESARRILRNRIFLTYPPGEMCVGMIKVVGKRYAFVSENDLVFAETFLNATKIEYYHNNSGSFDGGESIAVLGENCRTDEDYIRLTWELAKKSSKNGQTHQHDRSVGAILVSSENKILCASWNTNSENKTLHAEVNLIQSYCSGTGNKILAGTRIFTSLKPCIMCAGMIWDTAESPDKISVCYFEHDNGRFARETILNSKIRTTSNGLSHGILEVQFNSK